MRRYEIKKDQPKERKFTENQKFLSFSLEAPSKQLNFMPNTYPGLPSYYQTPYEDYLKCFKRQDETIEIQDLINQNEQRHEISKFQLSFPQQQSIRKFEGNAISRQMQSGISVLQPGNTSKMQGDPTLLRNLRGEISSIMVEEQQSLMRVEENILNIFNMKEEVDKIYKKLIN